MKTNYGLVLTGGGARAAYQAGVLQAIGEILHPHRNISPLFQVYSGVSAGAINGVFLASQGPSFREAVQNLCQLWDDLELTHVIKTDSASLAVVGSRWIKDLSLGGLLGKSDSTYLLDTHPLRKFLKDKIDFDRLHQNVQSTLVQGVAVTATNYKTGTAISFFEGQPGIQEWVRSFRIGVRESLTLDHVLASAAIPIVFPPVRIGECFFGDGGVRMGSPISPAIHLKADKILAIGIRHMRPDDFTWDINRSSTMSHISIADIAGVMLNAAFLDSLDSDVERLNRINQTLSLIPLESLEKHPQKLRKVPLLAIRPSQDLATLASDQFRRFPRLLRYLMKGIGASEGQGWDLLSYLAFDHAYTRVLLELGYADAQAIRSQVIDFFSD